jgi:hypothetical protein
VHFDWKVNSRDVVRNTSISFAPVEPVALDRQDVLKVSQKASMEIPVGTPAGDSLAVIAINRALGVFNNLDTSEKMEYWDNVALYKDGPNKGRIRYVQFFMFNTKEELPYAVQYLTAAEEIVFGDVTSGAYSDIQSATATAKRMVTMFGMSEKLGPRRFGSEQAEVFLGRDFSSGQNYSEKTAAEIDDEIRSIISNAYKKCREYRTVHIDKLNFVAEFLLKHEFMDEEQFKACMEAEAPTFEEIENIANEKARKSEEENKTAHENNQKAEEEKQSENQANEEITQDDLLDSFFRDMQNGTLNNIKKKDTPSDISNDEDNKMNDESEDNTDSQ